MNWHLEVDQAVDQADVVYLAIQQNHSCRVQKSVGSSGFFIKKNPQETAREGYGNCGFA
jgi:hypothetical protein